MKEQGEYTGALPTASQTVTLMDTGANIGLSEAQRTRHTKLLGAVQCSHDCALEVSAYSAAAARWVIISTSNVTATGTTKSFPLEFDVTAFTRHRVNCNNGASTQTTFVFFWGLKEQ